MSESKLCERIEEKDGKLFTFHNELSALEYKRALGDEGATARIDEVDEGIRSLFADPSLLKAVRDCLSSASTLVSTRTRRKALLLEREMLFSAIDDHRALRCARKAIRSGLKDFDFPKINSTLTKDPDRARRGEAIAETARVGAAIEPVGREMLKLANRVAQDAGYSDYAQAKLANEGMTVEELRALFRRWRDERAPQWSAALARAAAGRADGIEAWDLPYLLHQRRARVAERFDAGKQMEILRALVSRLGGSLDELPISIEFRDISYNGACYRVMPGKDVRILLNSRLTGFNSYFYLLHEFGHAIYYCYCPVGSGVLVDGHLAREIMADLWTEFLWEKSFLTDFVGASRELADEMRLARSGSQALRLLLIMRDSIFSLELLKDPDAPFAKVWRAVSREWLGLDDNSGAFEFLDFEHLLDMKSYAFAQVLSESAFASLAAGRSETMGNPEMLQNMIARFYRPGNMIEWTTKFEL